MIKLIVTNSQRKIPISLKSAKRVLHFLLSETSQLEIGLHFVGKKKISKLHAEYFQDPSPTDCISFPYEDPKLLGEIYVCPEIAFEYTQKNKNLLYTEITLYVVHGFLHLLGLNDQTPRDKKKMRFQEKKWMIKLAKNNLNITA